MKLLCVLLVLVNLFIAMFEFKYDINYGNSGPAWRESQQGQEKILLISELTKIDPDSQTKPDSTQSASATVNNSAAVEDNPPSQTISSKLTQDTRQPQHNGTPNNISESLNPAENTANKNLP